MWLTLRVPGKIFPVVLQLWLANFRFCSVSVFALQNPSSPAYSCRSVDSTLTLCCISISDGLDGAPCSPPSM